MCTKNCDWASPGRNIRPYINQVSGDIAMQDIMRHANKCFRLGDPDDEGLGIHDFHMPVADDITIKFKACVFAINVQFLLGLHVLRQIKLIHEFSEETPLSKYEYWHTKPIHKRGHKNAKWLLSVDYTEAKV